MTKQGSAPTNVATKHDIKEILDVIRDLMMRMDERFLDLENRMDERFSALEARIDALDIRLTKQIVAVDNKLAASIKKSDRSFESCENDISMIKKIIAT